MLFRRRFAAAEPPRIAARPLRRRTARNVQPRAGGRSLMAMSGPSGGAGRRRGRGGRRTPMSEINVTPLVDVMLVLLIIFMVTAPLLASRSEEHTSELQSLMRISYAV